MSEKQTTPSAAHLVGKEVKYRPLGSTKLTEATVIGAETLFALNGDVSVHLTLFGGDTVNAASCYFSSPVSLSPKEQKCSEFKPTGFIPRDPELTAKLHSERASILKWTLESSLRWLEQKSLSNDPAQALVEIAEFIDNINLTGQEYPPGCDKRAVRGWWQSVDFFYALQGIAHEARRVAGQSSI